LIIQIHYRVKSFEINYEGMKTERKSNDSGSKKLQILIISKFQLYNYQTVKEFIVVMHQYKRCKQ
jgi:hypothetical protein